MGFWFSGVILDFLWGISNFRDKIRFEVEKLYEFICPNHWHMSCTAFGSFSKVASDRFASWMVIRIAVRSIGLLHRIRWILLLLFGDGSLESGWIWVGYRATQLKFLLALSLFAELLCDVIAYIIVLFGCFVLYVGVLFVVCLVLFVD